MCSAVPICGGEFDLDAGAQKHPVCSKMRTAECRKAGAESFAEIPVLNPISLHADLVNAVGKERMDRSMIVGGSGGVRL